MSLVRIRDVVLFETMVRTFVRFHSSNFVVSDALSVAGDALSVTGDAHFVVNDALFVVGVALSVVDE